VAGHQIRNRYGLYGRGGLSEESTQASPSASDGLPHADVPAVFGAGSIKGFRFRPRDRVRHVFSQHGASLPHSPTRVAKKRAQIYIVEVLSERMPHRPHRVLSVSTNGIPQLAACWQIGPVDGRPRLVVRRHDLVEGSLQGGEALSSEGVEVGCVMLAKGRSSMVEDLRYSGRR
jgi:hypothetical protein